MKLQLACLAAGLCAVGAISCAKGSTTAVSPSNSATVAAAANADGSTIKATPPAPASPIGGQKIDQSQDGIVLVVNNSASKFGVGLPVAYRFELYNGAGAKIESGDTAAGAVQTAYTVQSALEGDQTYFWQARAEIDQGKYLGTWSKRESFVAPTNEGYINGNELYDPLINGKTVGAVSGPVTFVPGVGLRIESQLSYVAYVLPVTLTEGELSMLITDMPANTDGDKTKIFSMSQGFSDLITNERRMTVEKRGDPAGIIAWRFITHDDQVDAEGPERVFYNFEASHTYLVQSSWRGNRFNLLIKDGGADGRTVYNFGKSFKGRAYDPNPHVIFIGAPVGRSGPSAASVDHMTVRQLWVSGRPRPAFANK